MGSNACAKRWGSSYEAVCLGGDNDGAWDPTMEDMIAVSESFHLRVAVPRKWAQEVRHKCSCAHFTKEAYCLHAVILAMLMDPTVKPPAEDDIRVINQRKASKQRRAQKRQLVGDEEEPVVRKKPKDPPRPEPLLRPSRPEDSEEDVSEEEPVAKQSQETLIPRSAEKAIPKAEQQAKMSMTLENR